MSYLAVFGLYVGTMFVISINSMVWDYLDLVSRHMTIKEKVSRLKAIKELGLVKKDDFKLKKIPVMKRVKQIVRFFCSCRQAMPSVLKADKSCCF